MKKAITGLSAILLSLPILAQLQFRNLKEVLNYADKNSLIAKATLLAEKVAEKDASLYRATLIPRIEFTTTADYNILIPSMVVPDKLVGGTEGKYSSIKLGLPATFTPALEFSVPIINQEKWEEMKKLVLEKEKAKHNTGIQLEHLHIQLAQAYFNILVARELLFISTESKTTIEQLLSILKQRHKEGILQPIDYNRAKQLQADIDNNSINWSLFLKKSTNELYHLLNVSLTDSINLLEKLSPTWELNEMLEASNRPAFLAVKTSLRIAEQSLLQSKKAALPKLHLQARYAYQWQIQQGQTIQFDMSSVGVRFGVPLFAGGFYKTAQKKAAILTEAAKIQVQQSLAQLKKEQSDWITQFTTAKHKQKNLQQKIAATADNLRIAQLSIREGVMEFDDFNTIFQEWLRTRMEHLQVLNEGLLYQFILTQK